MDTLTDRFKCVVAALSIAIGVSAPVYAQDAGIDQLYQDLAESDESTASRIAGQIVTEWEKSGSPAMDLLLRRGTEALEDGQAEVAVDHFSALVDHAPMFAQGYYGRASSYFLLGQTGPALDDLRQVLALNPRHFEAMAGLAVIMEELGRDQDALEIYRMILDIHPQLVPALDAVDRLEQSLEGQAL